MSNSIKKLTRSRDRQILGVGGGLARYFDVDPTLVRIGLVLAGFFSSGAAILVYLIVGAIMPEDPS